jgi:hypothetical protein
MVSLSRRHMLFLTGGALLAPMIPRAAHSSGLAVAGIFFTAAGQITDMMQRGGGLELSIQSLDVELKAVLANQLRMMEAIATVDRTITDIQTLIKDVPIETVGLGAQVDAADATKNLMRAKADGRRKDYDRWRLVLVDQASKIQSAASSTVTTPSLAFAAWHVLNGIEFSKEREFGKKPLNEVSNKDKEPLLRATDDLRQTLQLLTSPESAVSKRLADCRERIVQLDQNTIAQNATAKLVLPAVYAEKGADPEAPAVVIFDAILCAQRTEPEVQTAVDANSTCSVPGQTMSPPCGGGSWTRETKSFRRMKVTVATRVVPGGTKMVGFEVAAPETWQKGAWSREVNNVWGVRVANPPRNVMDIHLLDGCVDLTPLTGEEYPTSLVTLVSNLGVRNALTTQEGHLVVVQGMCQRALERCDQIDGGPR